mgnify:CR=1 FL=1
MSHKARKRFGQNFLHDNSIIDRIINAVAPETGEHLVEIGPGKGALTQHLVQSGGRVDVIELDRDLIPILENKFSALESFHIHNADALEFNVCDLTESAVSTAEKETQAHKIRLVGNLPYNISTPLIFHLLSQIECIGDMHFMLQKEVVERLCAQPGTKQYGRLSILVQYLCLAELLFIVPPGAFHPVPRVDSAIVRLIPYAGNLPDPGFGKTIPSNLAYISKNAFAQRRKTLRNNLKGILTEEQISQCGIKPSRRAETLSIAEFVCLSNRYARAAE